MKEANLFWTVYKNLEQEAINFSKYIHFSSDQKKVYSMSLADLIVRCAVEIEAISKKIYKTLGGDMNPKIIEYLKDNPTYKPNSFVDIIVDSIGKAELGKFISTKNVVKQLEIKNREAIMNKHEKIYPTLS